MMSPVDLSAIFSVDRPVIGSIALQPLPGSPAYEGKLDAVVERALEDGRTLEAAGVDGLSIENMGDAPFFASQVPAETVASMGRVLSELRRQTALPIGVNVLRNDGRAALSLAVAFGANFIRVNVLTEVYATDQGIVEGIAADLMRARRLIGGEGIAVFADVHVKHATPLVLRPIHEAALDAVERGHADVLVVSGSRTGQPPALEDLEAVRKVANVVIGSGLSADNAGRLLAAADGAIVATTFRQGGDLRNPVDAGRVRAFMQVVGGLRKR
jgi:membrane complex biogenesis BtpA family protein